MDPLKLVALDGDDMEVVSTHLQDAVVKVADIRWRQNENRVVVCVNRFEPRRKFFTANKGEGRCHI